MESCHAAHQSCSMATEPRWLKTVWNHRLVLRQQQSDGSAPPAFKERDEFFFLKAKKNLNIDDSQISSAVCSDKIVVFPQDLYVPRQQPNKEVQHNAEIRQTTCGRSTDVFRAEWERKRFTLEWKKDGKICILICFSMSEVDK